MYARTYARTYYSCNPPFIFRSSCSRFGAGAKRKEAEAQAATELWKREELSLKKSHKLVKTEEQKKKKRKNEEKKKKHLHYCSNNHHSVPKHRSAFGWAATLNIQPYPIFRKSVVVFCRIQPETYCKKTHARGLSPFTL